METKKEIDNNQVYRYHLHLIGNFAQTGFGFMCMKKAFELEVKGYLRYISAIEIEMNLAGDENQINNFYYWCLQNPEASDGFISAQPTNNNNFNEFEIINSL